MTTIDDKLKLFAKVVFNKVEEDTKKELMEASENYDRYLEEHKASILKESDNMVKQMQKKGELKKEQIISKAEIDRQHMLLKKQKDLFDRTMKDINDLACKFTMQPDYLKVLEKSICTGLGKINSQDIVAKFTSHDIENYGSAIKEMIDKYKQPGMSVEICEANKDIIGGCVIEDKARTLRADCSIASLIEENRILIGKTLMDNLEQSR